MRNEFHNLKKLLSFLKEDKKKTNNDDNKTNNDEDSKKYDKQEDPPSLPNKDTRIWVMDDSNGPGFVLDPKVALLGDATEPILNTFLNVLKLDKHKFPSQLHTQATDPSESVLLQLHYFNRFLDRMCSKNKTFRAAKEK